MTGNSKIFRGKVVHERIGATSHTFSYPMTFFGFDLSELNTIEQSATLFGHNHFRPLMINDCDYLRGAKQPIIDQLQEFLPEEKENEHTILISSPRYFGYAFNPVNFYLRMAENELISAVAEVNNTFGDRHIYALTDLVKENSSTWTARCAKDFHVSPFNDMTGEYFFTFRIAEEEIFLGVDLWNSGNCVMKTWIEGKARALTNAGIRRYVFLHPLDTAANSMPRILWQAAILYFCKKMQVFKRPHPVSENTVIDRDQPNDLGKVI